MLQKNCVFGWTFFFPLPLFLGAFAKLRKTNISSVMFVCLLVHPSVYLPLHMEQSATTGRTLMKFYISVFFEILSGKFNSKCDKNNGHFT
jgi:hypothetical protein